MLSRTRRLRIRAALVAVVLFFSAGQVSSGIPLEQKHPAQKGAAPAEVWIKEPLVVGLGSPFEIAFFDRQGRLNKNLTLDFDLVFKLDGIPFNILTCDYQAFGLGKVRLPAAEIVHSNGVVVGEIAVERLLKNRILKVYRSRKGSEELIFIGQSRIDKFFRDIAGVWFSERHLVGKAGQEFEIAIFPFNYLGKGMLTGVRDGLQLMLVSPNGAIINDREINGEFNIPADRIIDGVATIKVRMEKGGRYILVHNRDQAYFARHLRDDSSRVTFDILQ